MTFAFSHGSLERLIDEKFKGEWKYLKKVVFDMSEQRAIKACIELAIYLRAFDDEAKISKWLEENSGHGFGNVICADGKDVRLTFREVANKIIHTAGFKWDFSTADRPLLVCTPRDNQRWRQASIDIVALAAICGEFIS